MAIMIIKTTYALDAETVRILEDLAHRKGMSKSAVLRDAIRCAAALEPGGRNPGVDALDRLQAAMAGKEGALRTWGKRAKAERRASSARRERNR